MLRRKSKSDLYFKEFTKYKQARGLPTLIKVKEINHKFYQIQIYGQSRFRKKGKNNVESAKIYHNSNSANEEPIPILITLIQYITIYVITT